MNETTVTVVGMVCSEIRYGQSPADESPVARFQIRTASRRYDKRTGTWTEGDPSYYSLACRRTLADHVASSMGVGDPVVATGRLRICRWRRGEENMISAEIEVQAIGHDLRCGTTVYRRSTPPARIPGPGRARSTAAVEEAAEREALTPVGASAAAESLPELERQKPSVGVGAGLGTGTETGTGTGTEVIELPVAA